METPWHYLRAGGRRRYNRQRQFIAMHRRLMLLRPMLDAAGHPLPRGCVTMFAKSLGVSPSTVSRDIQQLLREGAEGYWAEQARVAKTMAGFDPLAEGQTSA
jgi:hypothetical protein